MAVVVARVILFLFSSEGSFHVASLIGTSADGRNLSPGQSHLFSFLGWFCSSRRKGFVNKQRE